MINDGYRVPDCPVFKPTAEQWSKDPFEYIRTVVAPSAQATAGIAKIIPPAGWRVPFSLPRRDSFMFTPRVQVLNALEATVRAQAQFVTDLRLFHFVEGHPLSPPLPVCVAAHAVSASPRHRAGPLVLAAGVCAAGVARAGRA